MAIKYIGSRFLKVKGWFSPALDKTAWFSRALTSPGAASLAAALGSSTAEGIGAAFNSSNYASSGTATVTANGVAIVGATYDSIGLAAAIGNSSTILAATGTAAGVVGGSGQGVVILPAMAQSVGSSEALGEGAIVGAPTIVETEGSSVGSSTASAVGETVSPLISGSTRRRSRKVRKPEELLNDWLKLPEPPEGDRKPPSLQAEFRPTERPSPSLASLEITLRMSSAVSLSPPRVVVASISPVKLRLLSGALDSVTVQTCSVQGTARGSSRVSGKVSYFIPLELIRRRQEAQDLARPFNRLGRFGS